MEILFSLLFLTNSWAADLDFHGYLRAGAGTNGKGAKQECFVNRGAQANEFRLGNECSVYGEAAFLSSFLKGTEEEPFFKSQVRLAFFPQGKSSFEESDSDGRDINIVEAFVEGGRLDGSPLTYWAGKRFYRDVDLYIHDWYYFGNMSGNGAGVGNIPLGSGRLAAAYLMETGSTRTDAGQNAVQVLDLRWQEVNLGEKSRLHFWGAYGISPGGKVNQTYYQPRQGWLGAIRWRRNLEGGFNDFAILHGQNLLEGINLYGNSAFDQTSGKATPARRWRFVEHLVLQPSERIGVFAGAALELWDPKRTGTDSRGSWISIGARPVYFFTKHYQLAFEAGHSIVEDHTEKNADGSSVGPRSLTRFTLAPQLSVGPGLWARPLLRAFYTRSFWNGANKSQVAVDAPSFAGASAGQAMGFQAEVWF